ncbi:unnamed protein product [Clavelina lepadiformis]|uniref:Uncharacterized protein n=1 Tax=Clavelina lepadiformis TaxID=159417 RepID=A0ABP0FCS6_CLALP
MKVIVAGYTKTGTKTMSAALSELGYNVYDALDHFWYHGDKWAKILSSSGGSIEDFKEMYHSVDAVTDSPTCKFWEEILQAFPDAKVILTLRDEDSWYKSLCNQCEVMNGNILYQVMQVLSPTGWKYFKHFRLVSKFSSIQVFQFGKNCNVLNWLRKFVVLVVSVSTSLIVFTVMSLWGIRMRNPFDFKLSNNDIVVKKGYRQHTRHCRQSCPRDKLLVYDVRQGWAPLCEFLRKEIPDKSFPHENVAGNIIDKLMTTHPAFIRMQREMACTVAILSLGLLYGCYKLYKCNPGAILNKLWSTFMFR